jgi:hypothetical protein
MYDVMYYGRSLPKFGRTRSLISRAEEPTLTIELEFSSQISVNTFKTVRGHIPEDAVLHNYHGENINYHINNLHQILLVGQIGEDETDGHITHVREKSNSYVFPAERT